MGKVEGAERRGAKSAVNRSDCAKRLFVIVVFDGMVLEGQAFVEFGERNREADFGEGEGVAVLQDEDGPSVRGANVDGSAIRACSSMT